MEDGGVVVGGEVGAGAWGSVGQMVGMAVEVAACHGGRMILGIVMEVAGRWKRGRKLTALPRRAQDGTI